MLLGAFRIALLLVFLPSALQTEAPLPGTFPGRGALMNNFFRFIRECRSGHSILILTLSGIKEGQGFAILVDRLHGLSFQSEPVVNRHNDRLQSDSSFSCCITQGLDEVEERFRLIAGPKNTRSVFFKQESQQTLRFLHPGSTQSGVLRINAFPLRKSDSRSLQEAFRSSPGPLPAL